MLIYDRDGGLVYPYEENCSSELYSLTEFYRTTIQKAPNSVSGVRVKNPVTREMEYIASHTSRLSGWTVVISEPEAAVRANIASLNKNIILFFLITLVAALLLSYFVSHTITTPINKILKNMKKLSLEALPEKAAQVDSGYSELEELNDSFTEMCGKLQESLDEIVSVRSHEIQSRMLALQSQMNPHFLYNTIANISIMAEENDDPDVVRACRNLSDMLRFISSKSDAPITMAEELAHLDSYMQLMEIRYEDDLSLSVNIPEQMYSLLIPKLVIQPLVENCTKYAVDTTPPWRISVDGVLMEDRWIVSVRDNGSGFSQEALEKLQAQIDGMDSKNPTADLEIRGMGLINIYIRLHLMYGDKAVFSVSNNPEGGSEIQIGGAILS